MEHHIGVFFGFDKTTAAVSMQWGLEWKVRLVQSILCPCCWIQGIPRMPSQVSFNVVMMNFEGCCQTGCVTNCVKQQGCYYIDDFDNSKSPVAVVCG